MQYYVYMVACADRSLYTGYTSDIADRIKRHNGELPGGAKYTQSRRPVTLVYSEVCTTKRAAMQREYEIKQYTPPQKRALCVTWQRATGQR